MNREWTQEQIDDHMLQDDIDDEDQQDYFDADCGLMSNGQCSQAGTEHCDFCCPNRNSDLFVGSAAWRAKHEK